MKALWKLTYMFIVQSHRKTMDNECQRNLKTGALIGPCRSQEILDSRQLWGTQQQNSWTLFDMDWL